MCSGDFTGATLTATVPYGPGGIYHYYLDGNHVNSSPSTTQTFNITQPGKYTVTVIDQGGNFSASDAFELTLATSPVISIDKTHIPGCYTEVLVQVTNFQANHTYDVCIRKGRAPLGCFTITDANPYNISALVPTTLADGTYTVIVVDNQSCLSCETRSVFTIDQNIVARTLGQPNAVTLVNANGGLQEYKGVYIVEGALEFTRGDFKLLPGTRFYVKGAQGVDAAKMGVHAFDTYKTDHFTGKSLTYDPVIIKVSDAKLYIGGAILTTLCGTTEPWGGIYLTDGSFVFTNSGQPAITPSSVQESEISNACIGIASAQLTSGNLAANRNFYSLTNTRFLGSGYGFRDERKLYPAVTSEGIINCRFANCGTGVYWDNEGASGLPYGGNYALAVYEKNIFEENEYGFNANDASNLELEANTFTNNTNTGLIIAARQNLSGVVLKNEFNVPTGAVGMEANSSITVKDNIFKGTTNSANIGIMETGTYSALNTGNTLQNFETAILIGTNLYDGVIIESNTFTDNTTGVAFQQSNISPTPPSIRCNTFEAPTFTGISRGIYIPQNVRITAVSSPVDLHELGGLANTIKPKLPNGNRFIGITYPVANFGSKLLTYYRYNSLQEDMTSSIGITPTINSTATKADADPDNACGTSLDPGVNSRMNSNNDGSSNQINIAKQSGESIALGQSYPNPAQTETIIPYTLPEGCRSSAIRVIDIFTGREVKRYSLKAQPGAGNLIISLEGMRVGLYAYILLIDDKPIATRQLAVHEL